MNEPAIFSEIILPVSIEGTFTYQVPSEMKNTACKGMRVLVPFGKSKLYSGIIHRLHQETPEKFDPKPIIAILDDEPIVTDIQLQFWDWIAGYYMCTLGEVMSAALPSGLKLSSETIFYLSPENTEISGLNPMELEFYVYIRDEAPLSLNEIKKGPYGNGGIRLARKLADEQILSIEQQVKKAYKPRKEVCIRFTKKYQDESVLADLFDSLAKAPAQQKAVEIMVTLSEMENENKDVERSALVSEGVTAATIQALIKKEVIESYEVTKSRIHGLPVAKANQKSNELTPAQEAAFEKLKLSFENRPVALLQGVTSSGKTEIYIRLIREQIDAGKQVLYLLPEIAITTQMIQRLKNVFGDSVGVYHSKYSDNERVEVYRNMAGLTPHPSYSVIIGVRSALFLPYRNLGLVIVDEEHEHTYKQFDPAPRYHARDASIILALYANARILLGSATPSLESLHNAKTGKYGFADITERYGNVSMPEIVIADIATARKRKQLKSYFTPELMKGLEETFNAGKQAILFQNRRGYSNYMHCTSCGYILKCNSCDVSLTYHKYNNEMNCHYCGYKTHVPHACPECQSTSIQMKGFGTEKIEDEIGLLFPEIKIGRLDLDKSRSRKAFEKVISDFEAGKSHVLVGTQMVTKGLDFENVQLVGIIDADGMLNFPDFRAFERSYQLMVQVSGRAGRRKEQGKVIIQTTDPSHPVIRHVLEGNFSAFTEGQLSEREMFKYPPFIRLIRLTLRHEIPSILEAGAVFLTNELKDVFGGRVLGPQPPMVAKTHGKHIRQIMLKIEKDISVSKAKQIVAATLELFRGSTVYRQIRVNVDVDPM